MIRNVSHSSTILIASVLFTLVIGQIYPLEKSEARATNSNYGSDEVTTQDVCDVIADIGESVDGVMEHINSDLRGLKTDDTSSMKYWTYQWILDIKNSMTEIPVTKIGELTNKYNCK